MSGSVKFTAIKVKEAPNELGLHHEGKTPVIRDTPPPTSESAGYLWASGFKPFLFSYDGLETLVPLRIDIQHGKPQYNRSPRILRG